MKSGLPKVASKFIKENQMTEEKSCCGEAKGLEKKADDIIRTHIYASIATGFVPIPIVDLVAFTGVQVDMLRRLAEVYDVPFKKDLVKSIIGALVGGIAPVTLSSTVASLLKFIPIVGYTTSAVSLSISGAATTYALGKVFVQHFASGGTFLDFNPEKVRAFFGAKVKEGREVAADMSADQR
jgi:uncharacterized protein (DUF697 family)